jgi:hypothetical protein
MSSQTFSETGSVERKRRSGRPHLKREIINKKDCHLRMIKMRLGR